jgi:hypothetical protein
MLASPLAPAPSVAVRVTTYRPRLISDGGASKELLVERVPSKEDDHR